MSQPLELRPRQNNGREWIARRPVAVTGRNSIASRDCQQITDYLIHSAPGMDSRACGRIVARVFCPLPNSHQVGAMTVESWRLVDSKPFRLRNVTWNRHGSKKGKSRNHDAAVYSGPRFVKPWNRLRSPRRFLSKTIQMVTARWAYQSDLLATYACGAARVVYRSRWPSNCDC